MPQFLHEYHTQTQKQHLHAVTSHVNVHVANIMTSFDSCILDLLYSATFKKWTSETKLRLQPRVRIASTATPMPITANRYVHRGQTHPSRNSVTKRATRRAPLSVELRMPSHRKTKPLLPPPSIASPNTSNIYLTLRIHQTLA